MAERQPDPTVLPWNGFAIAGFVLSLPANK